MTERAQKNIQKVTDLQHEINEECKEIQQRIIDVRTKIHDNRASYQNFQGFLLGAIDDYILEFDSQIVKLNERFDQDKQYWNDQATHMNQNKSVQTQKLLKIFDECQRQCAMAIFNTVGE